MYPKGMYSCVAGFVDAGESLADCVARECAEEAGCIVDPDSIQLVGSNHWPNPAGIPHKNYFFIFSRQKFREIDIIILFSR